MIKGQKPFVNFAIRRFVYLTGVSLGAPLFPLFFVRQLKTPDTWIGIINTTSTAVMIFGYFLWVNWSRAKGNRMVLLWATFGLSLYPILVAITPRYEYIPIIAGFAGIFQAGLDLVFFDELMRTIPVEYSATFVSFAQSLQYLSAVVSPLVGTLLADTLGLSTALIIAGSIRLLGFMLFATQKSIAISPMESKN